MNILSAKVRQFVVCAECGKRRCIYSKEVLSLPDLRALERVQDDLFYVCGAPLFPEDDPLRDKLIVREGISCMSPIEITYYSGEKMINLNL